MYQRASSFEAASADRIDEQVLGLKRAAWRSAAIAFRALSCAAIITLT